MEGWTKELVQEVINRLLPAYPKNKKFIKQLRKLIAKYPIENGRNE